MIKLTDILREVGEGTSATYDYDVTQDSGDIYDPDSIDSTLVYSFETEKGTKYDVVVNGLQAEDSDDYYLDVEFLADSEYKATGEGKPLKIMSTVVAIMKEIIAGDEKNVVDGIVYSPVEKISDQDFWNPDYEQPEEDNQRDKMYRRFITTAAKQVGRKVEFSSMDGAVLAKFK